MTYWYINKEGIIKPSSNKLSVNDKLENTKFYDTFKKAVLALKNLRS